MSLMDVLSLLSLFVGIVSIILAIFAMYSANRSEQRSKDNFDKTQEMISKFYESTKDLLHQIETRTSVTEKVVLSNQDQLLNTMTTIVNETVIPKKQDMGEQIGMMFFQQLISNPQGTSEMLKPLKEIASMMEQDNK
ncbi:hypothetical protein [Paenibacillus barengoltzii]|uniref:hypothetical protein n=1 Tax=Paenibacillus barengoltzii TaxID=343517 RepID=UPI000FDC24D0|nr:hypothetical protein [Paenibacillus barengoltzii]